VTPGPCPCGLTLAGSHVTTSIWLHYRSESSNRFRTYRTTEEEAEEARCYVVACRRNQMAAGIRCDASGAHRLDLPRQLGILGDNIVRAPPRVSRGDLRDLRQSRLHLEGPPRHPGGERTDRRHRTPGPDGPSGIAGSRRLAGPAGLCAMQILSARIVDVPASTSNRRDGDTGRSGPALSQS